MNKAFTWAAVLMTASLVNTVKAENILGIDVSEYQGSINWTDVHNGGVDFAFAKANEGYDYTEDPDFDANMANGKAAGVQMGAYHLCHTWANTPAQEAGYFWSKASPYIKADGKSIMPMLDLEIFDGVDGASSYTAWCNDWSADVVADGSSAGVVLRPVIYISACNACELTSAIDMGSWIADYNGENLYTGGPWSTCTSCNVWDDGGTGNWTYWQVSDSGSVPGISGDVDLDAYPDSLADLKAWQGVTAN